MENIIYLVVGVINGLFSSGAGNFLVFYLIYILKKEVQESRNFSLSIMTIVSIPTFIFYLTKIEFDIIKISIFVIISMIFGAIGNRIMNKINGNILNLISGIFLCIVSIYSLFWRKQ